MSEVPEAPRWVRIDVAEEPAAGLAAAEAAVRAGDLIVLPTDTLYGVGADAFAPGSVRKLLEAKHRGRDMPPPVLIAEPGMLGALADDLPWFATQLADRFWPGALTLIVRAQASLGMDLGETGGTIAVRVPDHEFTRDLLRRTGPLAVSSANVSGEPPATTADEAIAMLGNSVAVYLDAGEARLGEPSTIIDLASTSTGRVLRAGAIAFEDLVEVAPHLVDVQPPELAPDAESASEVSSTEPPPAKPADQAESPAEA